MKKSALYREIEKLDAQDRAQLVEDVLEGLANEALAPPLTDAHLLELRARLAHYRAHPDEPTWTLEEIKAELGVD